MKTSKFFKISLIYFISLVLFVCLRIFFQLDIFQNISPIFQDNLSTGIIQVVLMFALPFGLYLLFFKKKPKETFKDLGFQKISGKAVLISIIIGVVAFILNIAVSSIFNGIIQAFGYNPSYGSGGGASTSVWNFLLEVLLVAILPGICEEFMHRGILLRGLSKEKGVMYALVVSSILFGLMHLNIVQVFYASILGFLIGFVSVIGKSIYPAIIIHFMNNFLNVYLSYAEPNGWPLGEFYNEINYFFQNNNFLIVVFVIVIILLFLIFLLFVLLMQLLKISSFESFRRVLLKVRTDLNPSVVSYEKRNELENEMDYLNDVTPIIMDNLQHNKLSLDSFLNVNESDKKKLFFKDKFILYATFIMGILITIFTFIWGVI